MPDRSRKRPTDVNERAFQIVGEATGEIEPVDPDEGKDPAAVALGRKGGLKGGKARAERMTAKERSESARNAARARWSGQDTSSQPTANLVSLRKEIAADLGRSQEEVRKLMGDLREVDRVLSEREGHDVPDLFSTGQFGPAPPLKSAILTVLNEEPDRVWDREELFLEIDGRGWGPGGANPRNTFTGRLRDLEKETRLRRVGRDSFTSAKNEEVPAM